MKCYPAAAVSALLALSSCYGANVQGTAAANGLPRMREGGPANLPSAANRYHQPAKRYRQDRHVSSSTSHHHLHRGHKRSHPRDHRSKPKHRRSSHKHRRRTTKRSSAHKSLKRFALSTKRPHHHKTPTRASPKSLYLIIKGRYSWPEAAHICWKNGYELAALDARNAGRLVKEMGKGDDGIRKKDAAYWFGTYEKKRKGPLVLRTMAKRKPSIHRLTSSSLDIRIPILCQVRHPAKLKDPFRYEDRRHYCDAPKTICLIGRKGPECQSHCPLGDDKLFKGKKGNKQRKQYKDSSYSSDSSTAKSSSRTHNSLYPSSSASRWSGSSRYTSCSNSSSYSSSSYSSTSSSY